MELNTIKPAAGAKHARRRVGRGIGMGLVVAWVRPLVVAIKGRNLALVASTRLVLRVVKCHCNAACQSVASSP